MLRGNFVGGFPLDYNRINIDGYRNLHAMQEASTKPLLEMNISLILVVVLALIVSNCVRILLHAHQRVCRILHCDDA